MWYAQQISLAAAAHSDPSVAIAAVATAAADGRASVAKLLPTSVQRNFPEAIPKEASHLVMTYTAVIYGKLNPFSSALLVRSETHHCSQGSLGGLAALRRKHLMDDPRKGLSPGHLPSAFQPSFR